MYIPVPIDFNKIKQVALEKEQQAKIEAQRIEQEKRKKQMTKVVVAVLAVGALYLLMKK